MNVFCIFDPLHYTKELPVSEKDFLLNKPGRAGFLPFGRFQCGVATSLSGLNILFKTLHHNAHRNSHTIRTALQRAHNLPSTQRRTPAGYIPARPEDHPRIISEKKAFVWPDFAVKALIFSPFQSFTLLVFHSFVTPWHGLFLHFKQSFNH